MRRKKPLVSIITCSWNREKYLKVLAKSLKNQSFKNFEWIIANDGSKDNTDNFIRKFSKTVNFRITYINSNLRVGKAKLTNIMMSKIKGKYTIECDSDDHFLKNSIENLLKITKENNYNKIKNFGGVVAQSISTEGISQTYKKKEMEYDQIIKWNNLPNKIDGDATTFALSKFIKNKKYLEVDFLITESSFLNKVFKNKLFILTPKIVKIMNRSAANSVSFGNKLQYTRGSTHCIAIEETQNNFNKKTLILKFKTIIKFWRYALHADINFNKSVKMLKPLKKKLYFFLFPISYLYYLRDILLNKVEKTHIEFDKNLKNSKIIVEIFN